MLLLSFRFQDPILLLKLKLYTTSFHGLIKLQCPIYVSYHRDVFWHVGLALAIVDYYCVNGISSLVIWVPLHLPHQCLIVGFYIIQVHCTYHCAWCPTWCPCDVGRDFWTNSSYNYGNSSSSASAVHLSSNLFHPQILAQFCLTP